MTDTAHRESGNAAETAPQVLIGTSGFSYAEWKGNFYPNDLPSKKFLSYYARHFSTTEVNNTFYRLPTLKLTEGWYNEVPDGFCFTLKLSQKITHIRRLKNVEQEMDVFVNAAAGLKEKLGPILVQLPPTFRKDVSTLGSFLERFSTRGRFAFEFRHESWFSEEVYELLRRYNVAFGVVEKEEGEAGETPREVTGPFIYMRLRKVEYSPAELNDWASWIRAQPVDVFCYFKHDLLAPVLARQLIDALATT